MLLEKLGTDPRYFIAVVISVVVSICIHELAHGIVAIRLGDRTPIETGRMTLNPAVHMGLFSIITLLLAGIAWGSMPVDERRLRGRFAPALVALAGPVANVLLALAALLTLGLWQRFDEIDADELPRQALNIRYLLGIFGFCNVALALFNLIPIPPLDGSRVLATFSRSYATMIRSLTMSGGFIVVFILVFSFAGSMIGTAAGKIVLVFLRWVRGW